jgi:hypothetical protein
MRQMVFEQLSEAQACVEREDYQCAFDKLDAVGRMDDLSSYEQAQHWNFRGLPALSAGRSRAYCSGL